MRRYLVLIGELGQELQTKIFGNEKSSFESPNSKSEHIKPFKVLRVQDCSNFSVLAIK